MKIHAKYLILLIELLFFSTFSIGQDDQKKQVLGDTLARIGLEYYTQNSIDSAIHYSYEACLFFKDAKMWEKYVCTANNLAFLYNYNNQFEQAEKTTTSAYKILKIHLKSSPCSPIAISNMHNHYFQRGDFDKAIEILQEALDLNINNDAPKLDIATSYINLGNSYRFSGDYQNAFTHYKKALQIQLDTIPSSLSTANTYQSIGRAYQLNSQIDSAIYYLQHAERLLASVETNSLFFNKKIENFLFLAEVWNQHKNYKKTNHYIDKAQQFPLDEYHQVLLQETLGKIKYNQQKYKNAVNILTETQALAEKYNKHNIVTQKARRLILLADAYFSLNDFNNTLVTYQKALIGLSPNFENNNEEKKNPKADQLLDKPDALVILNGKAKTLLKLYHNNKETQYLIAAYDTYRTAADLIRDIRQSILTTESKNSLAEKTVPVYEGAIKCALELYQITKQEKYKAAALSLAESNKALLLLESINEQTAKGFAGIPDSLLEKEKDLQLNLAFLQKELLKKKAGDAGVKKIEGEIFELRQQLDRLTGNFEKNYPRYFELKYKNEPIALENIQNTLAKNENALVEYFVGEEVIYLFVVTLESLVIHTIDDPTKVNSMIEQLRPILNNPPSNMDAVTSYAQFTEAAHKLYTILLEPALEQLPNDISHLTIIPDDQLNYIPFDILLTKAADLNKPGYAPSNLEYVLEKYTVNYHYSATLLDKSQQRQQKEWTTNFVGFAPAFKDNKSVASRSCTADELYSLSCSNAEVEAINQMISGVSYFGKQALKKTFQQYATGARILHMATHACVDENDANFNKIFLTDDFLSNYDLYNMALSAELAVLSACNTGSGELIKGEGVMSLARGFINAGCSSTLMSMWSVDDCATSDIMVRFYEGLKKGLRKDEALRTAKMSYLESVNKAKMHPYYWSAFVEFGDVAAMEFDNALNWKYLMGGLALVLGLVVFFRKK